MRHAKEEVGEQQGQLAKDYIDPLPPPSVGLMRWTVGKKYMFDWSTKHSCRKSTMILQVIHALPQRKRLARMKD